MISAFSFVIKRTRYAVSDCVFYEYSIKFYHLKLNFEEVSVAMTGSSKISKIFKLKHFAPIACVLLVALLAAMLVFGLSACNKGKNGGKFVLAYTNGTKVEYDAQILGTVARNIPTVVKNEGLVDSGTISAYPSWYSNFNYTQEQRQAIINES